MAFVPVPNCAIFELRYSLFGQQIENTLAFEEALPWSPSALNDQCVALKDWAVNELLPVLSADITLREVYGTSLESDSAPTGSFVNPVPPAGGQVQVAEPGNVAAGVTFRTQLRGRSFRGRNYVAGIPSNQRTGNQVTAGFSADVVTAYQLLTDAYGGVLGTWVVVSRFHNGAPRVTGVSTAIKTALMVDLNIDSQRRRLTGRGT
jgi:hypothetical protein